MPKALTLIALGVLLAYLILFQTADIVNLSVALLSIGLLASAYWVFVPAAKLCPSRDPWLIRPALLLVGYVAIQLVPLPVSLLGLLSPARAALVPATASIGAASSHFGTLSVAPVSTSTHLLRMAAYALLYLLIRELAWRWKRAPWVLALPLVILALLQAVLGIVQHAANPAESARGSYVNRDHFAGLLEMVLPFVVMYPLEIWRRARARDEPSIRPALKTIGVLTIALAVLVAILDSYSRMGFASALLSLLGIALLALFTSRLSWSAKAGAAAALAALFVLSFVLLSPLRLIERYSVVSPDGVSADIRPVVWRDTLSMIAAYPVMGCGYGAFADAFFPYQTGALQWATLSPHSDYLQFLAELGVAGVLIVAAGLAAIGVRVFRASSPDSERTRYLALACAGAIIAILVHSLADFNLYVPPNALTFAWILGISAALTSSQHSMNSAA